MHPGFIFEKLGILSSANKTEHTSGKHLFGIQLIAMAP